MADRFDDNGPESDAWETRLWTRDPFKLDMVKKALDEVQCHQPLMRTTILYLSSNLIKEGSMEEAGIVALLRNYGYKQFYEIYGKDKDREEGSDRHKAGEAKNSTAEMRKIRLKVAGHMAKIEKHLRHSLKKRQE